MIDEQARVALLHEHYNTTCESLQNQCARRERLLIAVLLLTMVMLFQMASPGDATQQLADALAKKLELDRPCSVGFLDSVVWFGMICLVLRYCQTGVLIERLYAYVHKLEDRLNEVIGKDDITREGNAYLAKFPLFSEWTHVVYTIGFPIVLGVVLLVRWRTEINQPGAMCLKTGVDTLIFLACLTSVVLYMRMLHRKR